MLQIDDIMRRRRLCAFRASAFAKLLLEAKWEVGPVAAGVSKSEAVRAIVLIKFGRSETAIVKEIRSVVGFLELKAAKEFVDDAPRPVECRLDKPEAEVGGR
ncbi:50S ribosomal subunit L7/L12 [Candidatus Hodgkinia cicadicola]|nr:50S ribosomal subunit L7/L12 [Candidatus Hodgkinia cicadicola]